MTDFLVRRLIKDCGNINDPAVRARYGAVAGGVGIFLNLCLFAKVRSRFADCLHRDNGRRL